MLNCEMLNCGMLNCGMGILARSKLKAGKDAHPTRKFEVFFYLEAFNTIAA
jgi:hypothetical protein